MPQSSRSLWFTRLAAVIAVGSATLCGTARAVDLKAMVADYERPFVYAIAAGTTGKPDTLLFIHTTTDATTRRFPIGFGVTDLAVHAADGRLYVTNWGQPLTRVVDLQTQTELAPLSLGTDVYRLNVGRPGRLYVEGEDQWVYLRGIDSATGETLSSATVSEGDGAIDPTGHWYYHCDNNISSAHITRYDISGDTPIAGPTSLVHSGSRNLVISGDGSRLFWRGYVYDAALAEIGFLNEEIYATSLRGEVAFGAGRAINPVNGATLATLPFTSTVRVVAGNQLKLYSYNANSHALVVTPMSTIANVPGPGVHPVPASGTTIVLPLDRLSWDVSPNGVSYRVFFADDSLAVAAAAPGSPPMLGEVTGTSIPLAVSMMPGESYFWRVDVVGFATTITGSVSRFTVAPMVVVPNRLKVDGVHGASIPRLPLILSASAGAQSWSVTQSSAWLSLDHASGTTPDTLWVSFDTSALTPGGRKDTLRFTVGQYAFGLPVDLGLIQMTLSQMVTDASRPYIYALHPGSGLFEDAFLLFINTETDLIDRLIPIGKNPTDMALNVGEGRLYVSNWGQPVTRVVDLTTQIERPVLALGTDVYRLNAGRPGRIYTEEEDQWIAMRGMDSETGAELSNIIASEGDAATDPTGHWYYHCDDNTSSARITRYDVSSDVPVAGPFTDASSSGSRNLVISGDGSRLFWRGRAYDSGLTETATLNEEIYATTLHGDVAFSSTHAIDADNGHVLATLPFGSTVRAVSRDQTKLFTYHPTAHALVVTSMAAIAAVPGAGLNPIPADRATVTLPLESLMWDVSPTGLRYQVYFGTDSAAVAAAQSGSPLMLGEVTSPAIPAPASLALEGAYFWRVDVVSFSGIAPGSVWRFTVAPLAVSPNRLTVHAVLGGPPTRVTLRLTDAGVARAWTVIESSDWLSATPASGASPDSIELTVDPGSLLPGSYTDSLHLAVSDQRFTIPIALQVFQMSLSQMVTDYERPYVYALHPGTGLFDDAFLLFIHTGTDQVQRAIPIGRKPTDMALHAAEGRLYVSNWGQPRTRVVDLQAQAEVAPLHLGTDVYRINAGRPGRIYVEGEDQWVTVRGIDSETGADVGLVGVHEGDGACDPTGRWYYHCDGGITNAHITRYDITGDPPIIGPLSVQRPPGSRNLVMAGDGTRMFWRGYVYDLNLTELRNLGEEIYAATAHADVAFSTNHAINSVNGAVVANLPMASTIHAVTGDQQKLYSYNGTTHSIVVTPMASIVPTPTAASHPAPTHASTIVLPLDRLSWDPSPAGLSYRVYFGTDSSAVAQAIAGSPLILGESADPMILLAYPLDLGASYFWRVDVVGLTSTTAGAVWRFTVAPIAISSNRLTLRGIKGASIEPITLALTAGSERGWSVTKSSAWIDAIPTSGITPDSLRVTLATDSLNPGTYRDTLRFESGEYRFLVPVELLLIQMSVSQMVTDHQRPFVYALHPGTGLADDAFLLFLNTQTQVVEKVLPVGRNPTDLDVHTTEGRLYVTNWGQPVARVIDLETHTELPSLAVGTDAYRLNTGRLGRIYTEGKSGWIALRGLNSSTAEVLSNVAVREGDGETDPTGHWYYHCDNSLSTARITRYDITTDVLTSGPTSPTHPDGSRNLVLAGDGSRLFWRGYVYDAGLTEMRSLGEDIYSASFHGELAFGAQRVFNTVNGSVLATLPSSTVRALSGDQQKLFSFNVSTHAIVMTSMSSIAPVPGQSLNPAPANASTIVLPLDTLRWSQSSAGLRYQVYFGPDSTAVAAATAGSPLMVGDVTTPAVAFQGPLTFGASYYWRVDVVGFAATTNGPVWRFTVAPMVVAPNRLTVETMKGVPIPKVPLLLTSGMGAQAWSLTESATWLDVQPHSGATGAVPDTLWLTLDATGLNPATYRDTIRFTAGTYQFGIPVELRIVQMAVTQIVTDFERPYVYALHPGATANDDGFLLIVSTQTEKIVKMMPIGKGATDMVLHEPEGRLYVSNWGQATTRIVDLQTQSERPPIDLGLDVYRINAGRSGRIYTEGKSLSVPFRGIHSATGAVLSTLTVREGDAAIDPTGHWYYHCDNGLSSSRITRYDIHTDSPAVGPTSPNHGPGSRNLVMSGDGSRIFWRGYVYDEALTELNNLGEEVVASSRYGSVAYSSTHAIRVPIPAVLATLVTSSVRAISGDQSKLFSFDPVTHGFVVSPSYVSPIVAVDGPTVPVTFALHGVYPNPLVSSGQPTIRFGLRTDEDATLEVIDIQGRCVWRHTLTAPAPGEYSVPVAPTVRFSSGVYFLRLQQAHERATKRLVVTR